MDKPLWQIIKEIEEKKGISKNYLHYSWGEGELQLNIEFNNNIADKTLKESGIDEIEMSAFWE